MHTLAKFLASTLLLCLAAFVPLAHAQGPYQGRVIDKETKQPLEGAAVLAVWWKRAPGIAHPVITYHDAHESLTDSGGNFTIPETVNPPADPDTTIDEPLFYIFKPGYEAYEAANLKPPSTPKPIREKYKLAEQVYKSGGRMVVELKRITTREQKLNNLGRISISSRVPEEKYPNLIRLRDVERVNLGLSPTHTHKGKRE